MSSVAAASPSGSGAERPWIGRAEVWLDIDLLLDGAARGQGGVLLLSGPGGVGKSEVLRATVARAERRRFQVGTARALPDELPPPFSLVRDLAVSLARGPEGAIAEEPLPTSGLSVLFVPGATEAAPAVPRPPDAPEGSGAEAADALERVLAPLGRTAIEGLGAGRERLFALLIDHFLGLARARPLLIAVDDLPFADPSSLEFLRRLATEAENAPLVIVGTRGSDLDAPEANREALEAIERSPAFRARAVRPFSVPELTEFLAYLQGGAPPSPAEVERLHAQTDGNPLFVEQIVRSTLHGGPLESAGAAPRPDLVAVLLERIRAMDDRERRALTYAAVLGHEFDFARLAAVVGTGEERLSEVLDRLVLAGLLREKRGEVYEFVSEAVRASVYAELTETRRRILHRRVAAALEQRGDTSNFELARQFYLGREYPKTVEYNLRAAETAARSFAFEAAVSHLARALEGERRRSDRDPRREIRLMTECGRLLHETGELGRSQEMLRDAVALARGPGGQEIELGRALLALAWTRVDQGEYSDAEALATEAIGIVERTGTPRDVLSGHRVLGTVYWRIADPARAEAHQRTALEIAEREGTPLERGHALVDVANTLFFRAQDQLDTALAMYGRAAEMFATADDPSAEARVQMNRAVLEFEAGRTDDAFRDLEAASAAAERSRSPMWIGYCQLNLAQWRAELGDAAGGTAALDRAEAALRPLHDLLADQQIAMTRGMIAELERDYPEAEARYRSALEQARAMHLAAEEAEMLYRLAHLAAAQGERGAARRWLEEAKASGLAERRPDFAPRAAALEEALRSARDPPR